MSTNDASVQKPSKSVAAIVAIVVGVIALATSFMPIINNASFFLALVGTVFAIVALVGTLRGKRSGKGLAIASLIVNVLAAIVVLATQSAYSAAIDNAMVDTSDGTVESSSDATDGSGDASTDSSEAQDSKYSITDEQLTEDGYITKITGTYTNTSGKELSYVELDYNLYDSDGAQIGTAFTNTTNLADGASWKFEALCSKDADEIASYQLTDVTAH